jgi:secondary thiamine-phosphate synthase enzyme
MITFSVKTNSKEELIDITSQVRKAVDESKVKDGVCHIYTPHTTAAITIN